MKRKRKSFSDEIRDAVRDSGRTRNSLCVQLGINPSTMHRFVHGQCGISVKALDRLAEALDLHVAVGSPAKSGRK